MVRIAFWNVNRRTDIHDLIAELAWEQDIDLLILAEFEERTTVDLLLELNSKSTSYWLVSNLCKRIRMFSKFPKEYLRFREESDHLSISSLRLPGLDELLLVAAHLPSKMHQSPNGQLLNTVDLASAVVRHEQLLGHARTVVVGDLNMDPYEPGMVSAGGMNAVMTRAIAARGSRSVGETEYAFFYNPMWSHFGDLHGTSAGTYHYRGDRSSPYWHMFDQALLRPALAERFRPEHLSIITEIGGRSLLRPTGEPDATVAAIICRSCLDWSISHVNQSDS